MNTNGEIYRRKKSSIDTTFGKVPPQAKELEEAVLGAMMLDNDCIAVGMLRLFPEIFYVEAHQKIYKAIQQTYDRNIPIDILTVNEQLKINEELELVGGSYYLIQLTKDVVSGANIESHITIIAEKYLSREMIRIAGTAIIDAYEECEDVWDNYAMTDSELQKSQERVLTGLTKDIGYYGVRVLDEHATVKETGILGISTGLQTLNKTICGLVQPDLIVFAGRPGQGKTAMALSITHNTSIKGDIPCAWFSLEMNGTQLVRRLASIDSGITHERIRNGQTTPEEDKRLGQSIEKISSCKIFIDDKISMNVRHIRTKSALLKKKQNIQYIVVDYIQLMSGMDIKNKSREQIVSDISRNLKIIARELEIPVIALSQLSREVEKRNDKMPQLADLRESGAIEQDADEVIFLMRPEYYQMNENVTIGQEEYPTNGLCIANIAKNRHGDTRHVAIRFTGNTMHFTDYEKQFYGSAPTNNLPYKDTPDLPF